MNSKLFGRTNPNDALFNVATQEGSDILEGDDAVASIGDATMEHIQDMSDLHREAYDEFLHMPDGNIFRMEENLNYSDFAEMAYASGETLEKGISDRQTRIEEIGDLLVKFQDVTKSIDTQVTDFVLKDAIRQIKALNRERDNLIEEVEILEARNTDDVMGRREDLIPHQDFEQFGGMMKFWDLPPTPKPKMIWAGQSRQIFYDHMPEDHPMVEFVSSVLATLDRFKWHCILNLAQLDEMNEERSERGPEIYHDFESPAYLYADGHEDYLIAEPYLGYLHFQLFNEGWRKQGKKCPRHQRHAYHYRENVFRLLGEMIAEIAEGKSDEVATPVVKALKAIERYHFNIYKKQVVNRTKVEDPLFIFLCDLQKRSMVLAHQGKEAYNEVKRIGQELYEKGFVTEKLVRQKDGSVDVTTSVEVPRRHHWEKYAQIKQELEEIRDGIGKKELELCEEHVEKLHIPGKVKCVFGKDCHTFGRLAQFRNSKAVRGDAAACIEMIKTHHDEAIENQNLRHFTQLANRLMMEQKSGKIKLTQRERDFVWTFYNLQKQEVAKSINMKRGNIA